MHQTSPSTLRFTLKTPFHLPHPALHMSRFKAGSVLHKLRSELQTSHSLLHILHCSLRTLRSMLHAQQSRLHTSRFKLRTPHSAICTLHAALTPTPELIIPDALHCISNFTSRAPHFYPSHSRALRFTLHILHSARYALHFAPPAPPRASHSSPYTSRSNLHTLPPRLHPMPYAQDSAF